MVSKKLVSDATAHFNGIADSHVVFNGVPVTEIRTTRAAELPDKFSPENLTVSTVANLVPRKGHKTVIDAMSLLPKEIQPQYLIIGSGRYRNDIESYVSKKGLENQVHFTGYLPNHNQVFANIKASDIMALPSREEAFGIAYLEAMACGVPIIACKNEGPADFITNRETGFLVPYNSPRAVANVFCAINDDPKLQNHVAERGQRTVFNRFTWERNAKYVERILYDARKRQS